jgi:hypothetical protein
MKDLIERHEACINTLCLIIESERTLEEMLWSNGRNNEQGLKPYHSEDDIRIEMRAIERLQERYNLLTAKL